MKKRCIILNIGTELLVGHVVNTNANYLSKLMNSMGYSVLYHLSCGDNFERSFKALDFAISNSDLVVITGGLGPTEDDITREIVAKYFDVELHFDKSLEHEISSYFSMNNVEMSANNLKQASYPKGARPLKNTRGTAPGFVYETGECTIVALPGVPSEMVEMSENEMKKYILGTGEKLFSKYIKLSGISESRADEVINDIFVEQNDPTIGIYSDFSGITLRISTMCKDEQLANELFMPIIEKIESRLKKYIFSLGAQSIEETLVEFLRKKSYSISFAESCTGGLLASTLTSVSGVSDVFKSSFVTYSKDEKINVLGVSREIIEKYGVISKECAEAMAMGLYNKTKSDIVVSVTGLAGPTVPADIPSGHSVGEIHIGYGIRGNIFTTKKNYKGSRSRIRNYIVRDVFFNLFKILSEE